MWFKGQPSCQVVVLFGQKVEWFGIVWHAEMSTGRVTEVPEMWMALAAVLSWAGPWVSLESEAPRWFLVIPVQRPKVVTKWLNSPWSTGRRLCRVVGRGVASVSGWLSLSACWDCTLLGRPLTLFGVSSILASSLVMTCPPSAIYFIFLRHHNMERNSPSCP